MEGFLSGLTAEFVADVFQIFFFLFSGGEEGAPRGVVVSVVTSYVPQQIVPH